MPQFKAISFDSYLSIIIRQKFKYIRYTRKEVCEEFLCAYKGNQLMVFGFQSGA
jgi:hypothetical protein